MMLEKMLDRMPDAFNKTKGSNIYNLIKLVADQLQTSEDTLERIRDWQDIDQAQGKTLDKIGKDIGVPREGFNDEQYRQKIKIKIRSNLSGGEIETLNSICIVLLGDRFCGIQEGWTLSDDHPLGPTPATMLFTVKADGVNFGLPMAEIDDISAGGVAANWELLIDHALDFSQVDYKTYSQRYLMSGEDTAQAPQQSGVNASTNVELAASYLTAVQHQEMAGEQQGTMFYNGGIDVQVNYMSSMQITVYAGTQSAGEGGLF